MKTILLVEDDHRLRRGIAFRFEKDGYAVHSAQTLAEARSLLAEYLIDLVILDLNLPDGDGLDFCCAVRTGRSIPIVMLTARDLEADELAGLGAGADDYITKPFSLAVLAVRVEILLRRYAGTGEILLHCGAFTLDLTRGTLLKDGVEIPVSPLEFRLLHALMSQAGKVLSKAQILEELWDAPEDCIDDNTLSVNISRLRSKIENNPRQPRHIKTVYGLGYGWVK
ncbi:MAG: response regulator transcription factor [Defluviitaleaceae bacterium]|nr:response regulator transcription factor [Defluviitaleaceae bacterium]MCL2274392.1 response regulator transcription factor [Defluviitaleaceae bacterium]